ncbi:DUF1015 family protein [Nonomuraea sp. NPDC050691]|uniref:DUF1015 domain-containing protein n=1 Tax=Nonomuraea sp. NPDC050691 TaxID=3155661 RepID=UPI0033ECCD74
MDVSTLDHCVRPPSSADDGSARLATESEAAGVLKRLLEDSDVYGSMPDMGSPELPVPDGLVLRPFRGVRFAVDDPAKVTSPPYDLISDDDVRALLHSHANNVVRLILPRPTTPPADTAPPSAAPETVPAHDTSVSAHGAPEATDEAQRRTHAAPGAGRRATNDAEKRDANSPVARDANSPHEPDANSSQEREANGPNEPATNGRQKPDANTPEEAQPGANVSDQGDFARETRSTQEGDFAQEGRSTQEGDFARVGGSAQQVAGIDETRYAEARDTLRAWLDAGVLVTDELPALYVYEQSGPTVLQRGLIGDVGIADPTQGIILPHEHVFPGPVADRLALMSTTQANLEPIFLLYDGDNGQATRLVDEVATTREPLVVARTEDGLTHRLWAITDRAEIAAINADLRPRQALIADGHHRYATYRVLQRQEHTARAKASSAAPQSSRSPATRASAQEPLPRTADQASSTADSTTTPSLAEPATTPFQTSSPSETLQPETFPTHTGTSPSGAETSRSPSHSETSASENGTAPSAGETFSPEIGTASSHSAVGAPLFHSRIGMPPKGPTSDETSPTRDRARAGRATDGTPEDPRARTTSPTPDASQNRPDDAQSPSAPSDVPETRKTWASEGESGPWDFGLALLVDVTAYPPDLKAIHRVIPALPLAEAVARAKGSWQVHDYPGLAEGLAALDAASGHAFLVAGEGGAHLLTDPDPMQLAHAMPADRSDRWNALNTSILTEFLMPKVWGIRDDEQTVRIVHHDAHAAVEQAVQAGGTAVILKPLMVADVLAVAASGERVPRKSTSFGPKPRTGLVLRTFATG